MLSAIPLDPCFRFCAILEAVNRCWRFAVARQHFDIEAAAYAALGGGAWSFRIALRSEPVDTECPLKPFIDFSLAF